MEINERGLEFDEVKLLRDEKALDTIGIPIKIVSAMSDRPLSNMFISLEECTKFVSQPSCGAISTFLGITRDNFDNKTVTKLSYEGYVPMAEKELIKL